MTCDSPAANGQNDYVTIKYAQDNSPSTPTNISPANGASSNSPVSNLRSSPFSDPDTGDTHIASHWQVTTSSDNYDNPVFDSGADNSNLTQIALPSGTTNYGTTYYWHMRYQDNHGGWSDWSPETSFTVAGRSPNQPSNIVPPTAATGVSSTPTLQCSPFSDPDSGNVHSASQWQVRKTSGSYSSPIYDSGTDNTNLTILTIPSDLLSHSTTYCWHVRHQDSTGLWSDWSAETFFTTAKGGLPFWIWIIVGIAVVLIVGAIAYLLGKRRRLGQHTAQTTRDESQTEQTQKGTTSVPASAKTQSKTIPERGTSYSTTQGLVKESSVSPDRRLNQPKGATWKRVIGWILFVWGVVGLVGDIVFVLISGDLILIGNAIVCILFIWGGWRLSHPR